MVRIRLQRVGLKRQPSYRIVVTDQRKARNGKEIEIIGHHNPRTRPSTDIIDEARALYWLSVGAQPSDAVRILMERTGTMARFQRLRSGEELDTLVAEAQKAVAEADPVDPRTAYPSPAPGEGKGPRAQERNAVVTDIVEEPAAESTDVVEEPAAESTDVVEEPAAESTDVESSEEAAEK
jgi:small subunit ribosomal protein S16